MITTKSLSVVRGTNRKQVTRSNSIMALAITARLCLSVKLDSLVTRLQTDENLNSLNVDEIAYGTSPLRHNLLFFLTMALAFSKQKFLKILHTTSSMRCTCLRFLEDVTCGTMSPSNRPDTCIASCGIKFGSAKANIKLI